MAVLVSANASLVIALNQTADWTTAALAFSIQRHYLKVICAVGFPGNLAALLTVSHVRPVSAGTFLVALLAASDSLALLVKVVSNQLHLSLRRTNGHFCRSLPLANVCSSLANWVLVLIAFERLVAVRFPMLRHRFLSKRRVGYVCLIVLLLLFSIHAPIMSGLKPRRRQCVLKRETVYYALYVYPWLNTLLYALVPLVLLVVVTTALLVSLRKAKLRRRSLMAVRTANSQVRRSERAVTSMTITAALFFILMVLPQCLFFLIIRDSDDDVPPTAKERLVEQITFLLADSTHALNFYLYFLSVQRFRKYFLKMVRCRGPCAGSGVEVQSSVSRSSNREGVPQQGRELNSDGIRVAVLTAAGNPVGL